MMQIKKKPRNEKKSIQVELHCVAWLIKTEAQHATSQLMSQSCVSTCANRFITYVNLKQSPGENVHFEPPDLNDSK